MGCIGGRTGRIQCTVVKPSQTSVVCFFKMFFKNLSIFSSMGATPLEVMLRPRNSISGCPKAHLALDSFGPPCLILMNTDSMLSTSSSTLLAAMPMSSTYWAHLSALTKGSKYSRTVLLKADRDRFSPWASLR